MSRNFSFKLVPEGHYVLIPIVLLFRTLLEPPFGIVFRACALSILFKRIIPIHPVR